MHSRVVKRVGAVSITALMMMSGILTALSAKAATSELPFEVVFPQEASVTQFSSTFGARRSGGRRHKGNDLMAPRMTEVYAIADGVVDYVGINRLSGRNIRILHEDGWMSYYLHLNNDTLGTDDGDAPWTLTAAPGIEEGAPVLAGQLIGWVGDSGNAEGTAPHTHFELRRNGSAINPYQFLSAAQERALQKSHLRAVEYEAWLARKVIREQMAYPID
ncbi:MAG TPA: M23 family metallopeptidase [Acidimicrobiia bacterium]|nr:M23 family metallopeptidase [Acidimicrobiia bacterium]